MSENRKRVLYVLGSDAIGGCEKLTLDLAKYLANRGVDSQEVVFLSPRTHLISNQFERLGIVVHECPVFPAGRLDFLKRFSRLCRVRGIRHLIAHGFGFHFFVALAGKLGGVSRMLALVQNPAPTHWRPRAATAVLAQLARPLVYREVACSEYVADSMRRRYFLPRDRIVVVPNWCDARSIGSIAQAARRDRRREATGPIIGMVARLDPIKDQLTVIRAFSKFRGTYPKALLRLIGDGPARPMLEAAVLELRLTGAVEFLGRRMDVPEQLALLDLFVYGTTEDEGFGIVLIEAMAAGVPIICTDVGPCSEVLDGGRVGVLVPPKDPEAMSRAMTAVWSDEHGRQARSEEAVALARTRYSVDTGAVEILRLLAE